MKQKRYKNKIIETPKKLIRISRNVCFDTFGKIYKHVKVNKNNKLFVSLLNISLLIFYLVLLSIFSYSIIFSILFRNFTWLKFNIQIDIFIFIMISVFIISIIKIVSLYRKRFWFIFTVSIVIIIFLLTYQYIYYIYVMNSEYPTEFRSLNNEPNLTIRYNIYNHDGYPFARKGNTMCFNVSIENIEKSEAPFLIGVDSIVIFSNGIPNNNLTYEYIYFSGENSNISFPICNKFTEYGVNQFFPYIIITKNNENKTILSNTYFKVDVKSEEIYENIMRNRNLFFVIAFATIPITLTCMRTLRELWKKR